MSNDQSTTTIKNVTILFKDRETDLQLNDITNCNKYIQENICPLILKNNNNNNFILQPITKNDNTNLIVDNLLKFDNIFLYAYGNNIQRLLAIFELLKIKNDKLLYSNTWLNAFIERKDINLITKKRNIPILFAALSINSIDF